MYNKKIIGEDQYIAVTDYIKTYILSHFFKRDIKNLDEKKRTNFCGYTFLILQQKSHHPIFGKKDDFVSNRLRVRFVGIGDKKDMSYHGLANDVVYIFYGEKILHRLTADKFFERAKRWKWGTLSLATQGRIQYELNPALQNNYELLNDEDQFRLHSVKNPLPV